MHRIKKVSSKQDFWTMILAPTDFAEMKKKPKDLIICYFLGNTSPLIFMGPNRWNKFSWIFVNFIIAVLMQSRHLLDVQITSDRYVMYISYKT